MPIWGDGRERSWGRGAPHHHITHQWWKGERCSPSPSPCMCVYVPGIGMPSRSRALHASWVVSCASVQNPQGERIHAYFVCMCVCVCVHLSIVMYTSIHKHTSVGISIYTYRYIPPISIGIYLCIYRYIPLCMNMCVNTAIVLCLYHLYIHVTVDTQTYMYIASSYHGEKKADPSQTLPGSLCSPGCVHVCVCFLV